jgi:Fe-S oxidoreductase
MGYLLGLLEGGKLRTVGGLEKERLLRRYAAGDDKGPGFVYHCPCHLCAIGGVGASMELLEKVCGVNVVDLGSGCCGLAGTFGMQKKNYDLSSKISERLTQVLERADVKYVLTECSACKMQIEHISNCIVSHPVKILAEAYAAASR